MSNTLEYKGFQQTKNHFEFLWLQIAREDFISKMVSILVSKTGRTALAIRLSDTDIGSVFIHLASNRSYAHRWETEDEAQGTASITKHYTASLAKHVTSKRAKKKLIVDLQNSLLSLMPPGDIDIIRIIKDANNPVLPEKALINSLEKYLKLPYVKPEATPIETPKAKAADRREIKVFQLEQSLGERIFNGFLKLILAAALLLIAMLIYMQLDK